MSSNYYLSEQDVEALKRLTGKVRKDPGRLAHDKTQQQEEPGDEMYIAVPPCGEGIPARIGTTPGSNYCCLFKLVASAPSSGVTGFNYTILPLLDIKSGDPVRVNVYNIYDQAIPAYLPPNEKYIQIKKDDGGKWLAVPPIQFSSATVETTTTNGLFGTQQCSGNCKWTWNGSCWTTDGCTTSTTSTTTTTTSSTTSTTSTTQNCLCPGTTSTTTSTTTTATVCSHCIYPPLCGTTVGQCYYSSCSISDTGQLSKCSCITTTTANCNCATTSTPGPCDTPPCGGQGDNCGGNCTWYYNGTNWVLVYQGCPDCNPPPTTADKCSAYVSYCSSDQSYFWNLLFTGFGGGGGGPCSNSIPKCCWCWWNAINQWVFDSGDCCFDRSFLGPLICHTDSLGQSSCTGGWLCLPPSFSPVVDASGCNSYCDLTATTDPIPYCSVNPGSPCVCDCSNGTGPTTTSNPNSTTTTPGPYAGPCSCGHCYTTTTPSPPAAGGYCLWQCSGAGGTWSQLANHCSCSVSCNCGAPTEYCQSACQIEISSCTSTTTTT